MWLMFYLNYNSSRILSSSGVSFKGDIISVKGISPNLFQVLFCTFLASWLALFRQGLRTVWGFSGVLGVALSAAPKMHLITRCTTLSILPSTTSREITVCKVRSGGVEEWRRHSSSKYTGVTGYCQKI